MSTAPTTPGRDPPDLKALYETAKRYGSKFKIAAEVSIGDTPDPAALAVVKAVAADMRGDAWAAGTIDVVEAAYAGEPFPG